MPGTKNDQLIQAIKANNIADFSSLIQDPEVDFDHWHEEKTPILWALEQSHDNALEMIRVLIDSAEGMNFADEKYVSKATMENLSEAKKTTLLLNTTKCFQRYGETTRRVLFFEKLVVKGCNPYATFTDSDQNEQSIYTYAYHQCLFGCLTQIHGFIRGKQPTTIADMRFGKEGYGIFTFNSKMRKAKDNQARKDFYKTYTLKEYPDNVDIDTRCSHILFRLSQTSSNLTQEKKDTIATAPRLTQLTAEQYDVYLFQKAIKEDNLERINLFLSSGYKILEEPSNDRVTGFDVSPTLNLRNPLILNDT